MKAVVLKSENNKTVVLTKNGDFEEIHGTYRAGDEIEIAEQRKVDVRKIMMQVAAIAAAFLIFFSGFTYYGDTYKAYATVKMTGDAEIEFSVNKKEEIVKVKALNKESEDVVEELKARKADKRMYIDDGIDLAKKIIKKKKHKKKAKTELVLENSASYQANGRTWKSSSVNKAAKKAESDGTDPALPDEGQNPEELPEGEEYNGTAGDAADGSQSQDNSGSQGNTGQGAEQSQSPSDTESQQGQSSGGQQSQSTGEQHNQDSASQN